MALASAPGLGVGPRQLIVNADDFGLTPGIGRAVVQAHADGIVTSASVIALGPAFAESARMLDDVPELGVGLHLALVGEDPPLLSAREIPTLVDARGRLASSWRAFVLRAARGRVDPADVARELTAQAARVVGLGRPITHVDSHQHLHLWPVVRGAAIAIAQAHGIPAIRLPRSAGGRLAGWGVNWLARGLARDAAAASLAFPAAFAGFDEAGRLDAVVRDRALDALASTGSAVCELGAHPGTADDPARARYAWGYRWADELAALSGPVAREAVARRGFTLASFAALAPVAK